jgi:hypothetical protein
MADQPVGEQADVGDHLRIVTRAAIAGRARGFDVFALHGGLESLNDTAPMTDSGRGSALPKQALCLLFFKLFQWVGERGRGRNCRRERSAGQEAPR